MKFKMTFKCSYANIPFWFQAVRHVHSTSCLLNNGLKAIRNVGIMAHIDAGKTTTTERMLYYAGKIHHMGEVHHGNTVTDYLEQERDRGITITSASVTIPWLKHRINIIDTPGHIDFTMQVEQTMSVIDGGIIILDGKAGVEAQTITVWRQADTYKIPRIVYVNKMDRPEASLSRSIESLKEKFHVEVLPAQVPVKGSSNGIVSIIDLVTGKHITWHGAQGEEVKAVQMKKEHRELWDEGQHARSKLIDKLADLDEEFMETVLKADSVDNVPPIDIFRALRRITISRKAVPVFCGSSYKNIGVHPLMDAVVHYLPSPDMREDLRIYDVFGDALSAKAFKVVHDKRKGPVTFLRIYTGTMSKNQRIYNLSKEMAEQTQRVLEIRADSYEESAEMTAGNIAAVTGLKQVVCGNLVTTSSSTAQAAIKSLAKKRNITEEESLKLLCPPIHIPLPVFLCSIESDSQRQQAALDSALEQLQREDPSLTVYYDAEAGQTVMGGMGELHLEIIRDRLVTEYGLEADMGPLRIAYKEQLIDKVTDSYTFEMSLGASKYRVLLKMSVYPQTEPDEELLVTDKSPDNASNTSTITLRRMNAIKQGIEIALYRGPKVGCPVLNARFMVHWLEANKAVPDSVLSSAATHCAQKLIANVTSKIMEPVMNVEVIAYEEHVGQIMKDMNQRRADIFDVSIKTDETVIKAYVPLAELLGYANHLRSLTSGRAVFTMEYCGYKEVTGLNEREAIKNITGFYPV